MTHPFFHRAAVLCIATSACGGAASRPSSAPTVVESVKTPLTPARVDSLILALRDLPGQFRYIDAERTGSLFEGSESLFSALGHADTLAVPALIECFGNSELASATLDGRRLQLGKLCFRAFSYTDYYERRLRSSAWMAELKTTGLLPGQLNATDDQLRMARDWWKRYFAAGSPVRR